MTSDVDSGVVSGLETEGSDVGVVSVTADVVVDSEVVVWTVADVVETVVSSGLWHEHKSPVIRASDNEAVISEKRFKSCLPYSLSWHHISTFFAIISVFY